MKIWQELIRISKYGVVGLSNVVVEFLIYNLLLNFQAGFYWASTISALAAGTNSFIWNRAWTFGDQKGNKPWRQYFMFLSMTITAVLINNGLMYLFLHYVNVANQTLVSNIVKFIAIGLTVVATYILSRLVIFRPAK